MQRAILALFETYDDANTAVANLVAADFPQDDIHLLARPEAVEALMADEDEEIVTDTAEAGVVGGGALGALVGLLATAGSLTLPVVGPALATGALLNLLGVTAAGAGLGAASGGVMGLLIGLGIAEEDTDFYVDGVKHGKLLLVVDTPDARTAVTEEILRDANALDVEVHHRPLRAASK